MNKRPYVLELYVDQSGWYRWRLKRGGRVVADSAEGYVTRRTLRRATNTMIAELFTENVYLLDRTDD